jgi:uncharacterized protein (TIGR02145 family)
MKKLTLMIVAMIAFILNLNAQETGKFTDERDSHIYKWVKIGNQIWMAENLAFLPKISIYSEESTNNDFYYIYKYKGTELEKAKTKKWYKHTGVLYNWVSAQKACPSGWHLPSSPEWHELVNFLANNGYGFLDSYENNGEKTNIGKALASEQGWWRKSVFAGEVGCDQASNNKSGFSAMPGGMRYSEGWKPIFPILVNDLAVFWSSTEINENQATYHVLATNSNKLGMRVKAGKGHGCSVRCIKN